MGGRVLDWLFDHVMTWIGIICIVVACLLIVVAPICFFMDAKSPTFSLKKDEWACVKTHRKPTTTYIQSGKVLVPVARHQDVCDVYSRIGGAQ